MIEGVTVVRWLDSPSGRSKRSERVSKGCFMLDHDACGKYLVGSSDNVSDEVDRQLNLVKQGKHPVKLLNALCERDPEIRVYEYPESSKAAQKALLKELKALAPHLCLN